MNTLHFRHALLPAGWARDVRISITGTDIAAVETEVAPQADDARHGVGLPGMFNLHSHAFQRGMAGLAEMRGAHDDTFWTWRDVMYRFALSMTPDDVDAVALLAYVEMLEAGFTRVGEFHYLHHDHDGAPYANIAEMAERIASASAESGIGLTLLPTFYAHAGFGGLAPHAGQRRFINDIDGFSRLLDASRRVVGALDGANVGLAPHSLRAVTPAELATISALCEHGPIHIHAAEQQREVDDCVAWSGARPIQWLLDNAPVDGKWCIIHATHMTSEETQRLAASGAVVALCPMTEASLGDGVFPARAYADACGAFGIGTDSNVLIGVSDELRLLETVQRLTLRERNVLADGPNASTGRALFERACRGGALALAQSDAGLAPGARADIVALDDAHPSLAGRVGDAVLDGWIFAGGRDVVDAVWVAGTRVVADGRHRLRDDARRRFNAVVARLMS